MNRKPASDRFKSGDIIRYGSGVSALFRYEGTHNQGMLYGTHVLGGVHGSSDQTFFDLCPASSEDIAFCKVRRPDWFVIDERARQPRRRVVFIAKIEADDWERLGSELTHLSTEISRHGKLSPSSVSGGYSCGHIVVTSEDGSIDHDSWARELDLYLNSLPEVRTGHSEQLVGGKAEQLTACQRPGGDDASR